MRDTFGDMRAIGWRGISVAMGLGLLALMACNGESSQPAISDELLAEVEGRFDQAAEEGFSGVALVVVDGETVFERGYGLPIVKARRRMKPAPRSTSDP